MVKKYLKLNDIDAYRRSFHLSNRVWNLVVQWDSFSKNTLGTHFVRSVDSISAKIAGGFSRYTKNDKIRFYRISYGSVKESLDWNEKANRRGSISDEDYFIILNEQQLLSTEINQWIKYTSLALTK